MILKRSVISGVLVGAATLVAAITAVMLMILKRSVISGVLVGAATLVAAIAATQSGLAVWLSPLTGLLAGCAWIQFGQLRQEWKRRWAQLTQTDDVDATAALTTGHSATLGRDWEETLVGRLAEAQRRPQELDRQLQVAQANLSMKIADIERLQRQLTEQRETVAALQSRTRQLEAENATLEQWLQTGDWLPDQSTDPGELQEAQAHIQELEQRLDNQQQDVKIYETELEKLEQQTSQAQAALQLISEENTRLKQQLGRFSKQSNGSEAQHEESATAATIADSAGGAVYRLDIDCYDDLGKPSSKELRQVLSRIMELQSDPRPHGCETVKKYKTHPLNLYRIRSGVYRICYSVEDKPLCRVRVLMVDNRSERIYDEDLGRRLGYG